MQVRYVGPFDAVEIDGVGTVANGAVIVVPPAVAGTPPTAKRLAAEAALIAADGLPMSERHQAVKDAKEILIDLAGEMGSGLLAQVGTWEAVAPEKKEAKS